MPTSYIVQYAKSGRAACKKCRSKIAKGALRCGIVTEHPSYGEMTRWQHPECTPLPRALDSPDEFEGFEDLKKADQKAFRAALGSQSWTARSPAKKRARASTNDGDESKDEERKVKKMRVAEIKAELKSLGCKTSGRKAELVERLLEARGGGAAKIDADTEKLNKIMESLHTKKVSELKDMLRANQQLLGGKKAELLARIADAKVFGCMPKCPDCGGGTLRITYDSRVGHKGAGTWRCPGYMDDDEFVRCGYRAHTSAAPNVTRPAWTDP